MEDRKNLIINPSMFKMPKIEERVILFFSIQHFYMFHKRTEGSKVRSFGPFKRFACRLGASEVSVLGGMIGAPLAAIALENAIASGGKYFVAFGSAGWLNEDEQETGELITIRKGVDETGMAKDYGYAGDAVAISRYPSLPDCRTAVSVNSFYRLSVEKVTEYRKRQIDLIDMEAAPLSYIASALGASYYPVFVISDRVNKNFQWRNGSMEEKEKFARGLEKGLELLSSSNFPEL